MTESLGSQRIALGVDSSEMLKPLKMIISTTIGGNMASAASVDGAAAPSSRPSAAAASELSVVSARKLAKRSGERCSPTSG